MTEPSRSAVQLTKSTSRRKWARSMLWVRRVHLYSGMLMLPWVMLYGITATLFNHPGCLSDVERDSLDIADEHLDIIPPPHELAGQLLEALELAGAVAQIGTPHGARYSGAIVLQERTDAHDRFFVVDAESGRASTTTRPRRDKPTPAPFAQKDWFAGDKPLDAFEQAMESEVSKAPLKLRSAPRLRFRATIDGDQWYLDYDLADGHLTAATSPRESPPLRDFAQALHLAHGYPPKVGLRWLWAVLVDLMFLTLVFWGTSGVLMCLQMKRLRSKGLLLLGIGVAIAVWLVVSMHGLLR